MDRLASLQVMRALAAAMVLIAHVIDEAEYYTGLVLDSGLIPWTSGVDLFFVISGFIITLSGRRYSKTRGGTAAFLVRRFIRVVPLYYLFTTFMLAALVLFPHGVKETTLDAAQVLSSYAFFPYARYDGKVVPILALGWTLNYEIFFYLVFSAFLAVRWPRSLILLVVSITMLGLVGLVISPVSTALAFWTNPIMFEFVFGVLLAETWLARERSVQPGFWAGFAVIAVGVGLLIFLNQQTNLPRFIASGFPALIMVGGAVFFWRGPVAARLPRWILLLGDSSYALYLSHRFVLRAATLFALPLLPETMLSAWVFVLLVCLVATGVSVFVFRHVETPMLGYLNRRAGRRRVPASLA